MQKTIIVSFPVLAILALVSLAISAPTTAPSTGTGTGSIKGTVMQDGKPLANMTVRLMQRANPASSTGPATAQNPSQPADNSAGQAGKHRRGAGQGRAEMRGEMIATTQTDANGNFTFDNLASGTYLVVARNRETRVGGATEVSVGNAQSSTVSITARQHKEKAAKGKN